MHIGSLLVFQNFEAEMPEAVGDFDNLRSPYFGGMPFELARESVELFGKEVIPALREI